MAIDYVKAPDLFWRFVEKRDGCWLWTGTRCVRGYGVIDYHGVQWKAHRLALLIAKGTLDTSKWVCHHCDNPPCVNPAHLYEGTATDNNRDTVRRQRRAPPRTQCKRGHELTPDNVLPAYHSAGVVIGRRCKVCTLMLNKESKARHGEIWQATRRAKRRQKREAQREIA